MADNKTKVNRLQDLLPKHLNAGYNTNWKGLLGAIGNVDQDTADLISEVRKQFFVKTASRPYLDRLAANNKISRPRLVGMDDSSFREYIPVLSYKPKQVKLIIDRLLDVFFFKESTTAFITTQNFAPYNLEHNWEFEYTVDDQNIERIGFRSSEFTDISKATAGEIVAAINRQAKYSFAATYYDSITKNSYIRLFTNTIGSKGSIRINGGRANVAFRFNGFVDNAGNGYNTQWNVTKVGDIATFQHVGGTSPGLGNVNEGDVAIINISGNVGSFVIKEVDLANNLFRFKNLFATVGSYTQTSDRQMKFIKPNKYAAYTNPKRAMTWETSPGEIVVEMPTSPPVVKRSLKGSFHINGVFSQMANRDSDTSLTLVNAAGFPDSGSFYLERVDEIKTRIVTVDEDFVLSKHFNSRLSGTPQKYEYTSRTVLSTTGDIAAESTKILNVASTVGLAVGQSVFAEGVGLDSVVVSVSGSTVEMSKPASSTAVGVAVSFGGNTLTGITPTLPKLADINELILTSLERSSNTGIATTATPHDYEVGECVIIYGSSGAEEPLNGSWTITSILSPTQFEFFSFGPNTGGPVAFPGCARVERVGLANSGSKVILTGAVSRDDSKITGSYVWDLAAPFVLSSSKASTTESIQSGKIVRLLGVTSNDIPAEGGYVVLDYGKTNQEGPIRYLYKPTDNTIAIDPSYVFQKNHGSSATITAIRTKGPHRMSSSASEYPPYIKIGRAHV